jgi:hypothetical protein
MLTVSLKMRSKPPQHFFSIIDLAKCATRSTKTCICNMNTYHERGGRANCCVPQFSTKACSVSTRVAYSVPEVHELVAQSWCPLFGTFGQRFRTQQLHRSETYSVSLRYLFTPLILIVLLVNDSEYSRSTGSKPILSLTGGS